MYGGNYHFLSFHLRRCCICNTHNQIGGPFHILVTYHLLSIQSRMGEILRYIFSYIMCFKSYYGNPILFPYVVSWILFRNPWIEAIIYLGKINSAYMPVSLHWYMVYLFVCHFLIELFPLNVLNSCVVLIFPSRGNLEDNLQLSC